MEPSRHIYIVLLIFVMVCLTGCSSAAEAASKITVDNLDEMPYNLSAQQAYEANETGEVLVLDVREVWEYEEGHVPGAVLIPLMKVENRLAEIPQDQHVIVTCRSGNRSGQIAEFLTENGYTKVHNMTGGLLNWKALNFPIEK
jgi:rhodanese-related sulfurtransferase